MPRLRGVLGALGLLLFSVPLIFAQPPMPPPTEFILMDSEGNEVLRLAPDQLTSQMQRLPAGLYHLRLTGPGDFDLRLGNNTRMEVKRAQPEPAERPPQETDQPPMPVEHQPVVIDFDSAPGDQGMRRAEATGPGEEVTLQLTATGLPPFYGWSAVIEFDPQQLTLVPNSFRPSGFVPGLVPLIDAQEGHIEVGGANFAKKQVEGDGELADLAFATLEGFTGHAELHLTEVKLRGVEGTQVLTIPAKAMITAGPQPPPGTAPQPGRRPQGNPPPPPDEPPAAPAGQAAMEMLLNENACPGCDLSNANLMQQDLEGADLSGANLSRANLFRAKLKGADLSGADLSRANVLQANLREADLRQADLTGARLTGAKLEGANLEDAIIEGAKIQGANFTKATWIDGSECGRGSVGRCRPQRSGNR